MRRRLQDVRCLAREAVSINMFMASLARRLIAARSTLLDVLHRDDECQLSGVKREVTRMSPNRRV